MAPADDAPEDLFRHSLTKRQKISEEPIAPTEVTLPQLLTFGGGCSKRLPQTLQRLGLSRPLVVTDPFIANQSGLLAPILDMLKEAGIAFTLFSDCVPDPTTDSVPRASRCGTTHQRGATAWSPSAAAAA